MVSLRPRYNSPPPNLPSRKPVRHVHFEDEVRGRSRQRTSCEKTYHHVDVEEESRGRTRYRYRSRSRSRSRSLSRGQRRLMFRQCKDQDERRGTNYGLRGRLDDDFHRTGKPYKYDAARGEDRRHSETPLYHDRTKRKTYSDNLQEHLRYLEEIRNPQKKRHYYYYPENEHSSYRNSYRNKARTKDDTYDRLPRHGTCPRYSPPHGSYDTYHFPKDNFYKYDSYSSSSRSSSRPSSTPRESYPRRDPVYDPKYEYYRYQREPSRSRYDTTPQRRDSSRQYYFRRTKAPEGRSARTSWLPASDRSSYESSNGDGPGGVRIRVRYRRWV
ncbi:hypothetical protein P171DRAFT_509062 [Karstenula rhodostoma CBS 690.94]|uniref:Uncharacterized protein n=1 Tax=Karstenula rhodostoma CBS 690.94 TaxID=1392251 RepID=A0A9P4PRB6_9PLEO|nr:hypothetical protein P171DRAFT_509062 [Karstenula rhodostoma CBS 690.94]